MTGALSMKVPSQSRRTFTDSRKTGLLSPPKSVTSFGPPLHGHQVAEEIARTGQDQDDRRDHPGVGQHSREVGPFDVAVDEDRQDERIDHGDRRGLGGCGDAAQDAAEDVTGRTRAGIDLIVVAMKARGVIFSVRRGYLFLTDMK